MKNLKAIFWDNDGILVNTEPIFYRATKKILGENGIELTRKFYIDYCLKSNLSTFKLAEKKGFSADEIVQMRGLRNKLYGEMLKENVPVIANIKEVLEKLQRYYLMGVVTSSMKHHFDIIMAASGLRSFFDFEITQDDVKNTKPDPEPYLKALDHTGLKAEECLVIEDSERGLTAAKAAGIACYVIPTEISKGNDFSSADKVLARVTELPLQLTVN